MSKAIIRDLFHRRAFRRRWASISAGGGVIGFVGFLRRTLPRLTRTSSTSP